MATPFSSFGLQETRKALRIRLEQARAQITTTAAKMTEVLIDDAEIWQAIAATPLRTDYALTWRASVLPSEIEPFCKNVARIYDAAFAPSTWQVGALDGRMRMLDNTSRSSEETTKLVEQLKAAARSQAAF